jgi:hypothetical protein
MRSPKLRWRNEEYSTAGDTIVTLGVDDMEMGDGRATLLRCES